MSSYDAMEAIARAIQSEVAQPPGAMRFLPQSDEDVALAIVDALESAGYEIVRRDRGPAGAGGDAAVG